LSVDRQKGGLRRNVFPPRRPRRRSATAKAGHGEQEPKARSARHAKARPMSSEVRRIDAARYWRRVHRRPSMEGEWRDRLTIADSVCRRGRQVTWARRLAGECAHERSALRPGPSTAEKKVQHECCRHCRCCPECGVDETEQSLASPFPAGTYKSLARSNTIVQEARRCEVGSCSQDGESRGADERGTERAGAEPAIQRGGEEARHEGVSQGRTLKAV